MHIIQKFSNPIFTPRIIKQRKKLTSMAKFSATAIVFCCLFTITVARTLPENDDVNTLVSLPLSNVNDPFIRLHSDSVNAENSDSPDNSVITSVPLTFSTFRPINRRFIVRSKRPCRHHFKVDPMIRERVEIPYGDDMIVSSAENRDFEDPEMTHVGPHQRVRLFPKHHHHHHLHHHEDSDSDDDDNDDRTVRKVFKRYDYDRFDREKKLKDLKKIRKHFRQQNEEEQKSREEGSFMKRVRKFLDPFF